MLYAESHGEGPDLVLLHGWGMHGGIWSDWVAQLAASFRVTVVDLPGHGNSPYDGQLQLSEWAAAVWEVAPANAWWLGWSLGGLVALAAVESHRESCAGLLLMASTPKFVRTEGWQCAVDEDIFDQFACQLDADIERTLSRFLALQVRGASSGNDTLRQLRHALLTRAQPDPGALRAGLRLLKESDMREVLRTLALPVFCMLGERDNLVPGSIRQALGGFDSLVIKGAGHAPFLSQPQSCADAIGRWISTRREYSQHAAN